MPPTTRLARFARLLSRRATLDVETTPEWGVLRASSTDPDLEACRVLLETYGDLGSPLHGFFVEDPFDEPGTLAKIDRALAVVKPRLAAVNGRHAIKLAAQTAGSACEAVYLIAEDLKRAIADRALKPGPDYLGEEHGGGPSVSVTYPRIGTAPVETLREVYRLLPGELPGRERKADPQDPSKALGREDGRAALYIFALRKHAMATGGAEVKIADFITFIERDVDCTEFRRRHPAVNKGGGSDFVGEQSVKGSLGQLRQRGLVAGSKGAENTDATPEGMAWIARALGDVGESWLLEKLISGS